MMDRKGKLSLDQPAVYQIQVPGEPGENWAEWGWKVTITVTSQGDDPPVTSLTGSFDQAALQGMLRRLYSLGLPLISVQYMGDVPQE
jgi:hypothetical protein